MMEYGHGRGRGGFGGRGHPRDRSYSPPPANRQRGSPTYDSFASRGRGHGPPPRGRRDDFDYRDDRPPMRDGEGGRFDRRPNYDRPSFDRGYGGPQVREGVERDRDPYSDDGPGPYNRGPPGGGYGRRGGPESPNFDGPGLGGPLGSGDFSGGRRMSRALSPEDAQGGPPLSKVMFIKRMIDEDLPEKEIDRRYTEYLASKFKSKNKAEFERQKNDDAFKRRFDPFMFKEEVESRARTAQTTAVAFGKDFAEGKYDWKQEGRQQLLLPSEYKKAVSAKAAAPVISWHPRIIASCWKIACRLVVKMDEEKSVRRDFMEWVDKETAASSVADAAAAARVVKAESKESDGGNDEDMREEAATKREEGTENDGERDNGRDAAMEEDSAIEGSGKEGVEGTGKGPAAATNGAAAATSQDELLQGEELEGDDLATKTGQLDVMLEFLWQVHGVDFYSGADGELNVEVYKSVKERLKRTAPDVEFRCMRTSKPKTGALVDERKRDQVVDEFHHIVAKPWIERLKRVDPDTQKAFDLDRQLEAAVDIATQNMIQHSKSDDRSQTSYRCTFCAKKFKGEDYLRKHINNKHDEEMSEFKDAERNKAREDLFFENFESHQAQHEDDAGNADGGVEGMGMPGMNGAGSMINPIAMMGMQQMMMQNMMMGGMGNPMMGAGMGMPPPLGMNPMMMEQMMMGARGGGGRGGMMGGRGSGGRGGGRGGRGGRSQYYDFDSIANQRDQLNYGDI